jgi:hypothetical protein
MPICPGCERQVSYERLDGHLRTCHDIRSDEIPRASIERLERRLATVERLLDTQFGQLEPGLDDQRPDREAVRRER